MKYIFLLFLYFPSAFATPNPLLQCLGLEEERYHKAKELGPFYELNQKMISVLIQFSEGTHINNDIFLSACKTGVDSPSLIILEEAIYDSSDLFYVEDTVKQNPTVFNIQDNLIKEFETGIPEIFLNFLKSVQVHLPHSKCLKQKIPEIEELFLSIKYMQEHKSLKQIFKDSKIVPKVFEQLKNYKKLIKMCSANLNQKKQ